MAKHSFRFPPQAFRFMHGDIDDCGPSMLWVAVDLINAQSGHAAIVLNFNDVDSWQFDCIEDDIEPITRLDPASFVRDKPAKMPHNGRLGVLLDDGSHQMAVYAETFSWEPAGDLGSQKADAESAKSATR